MGRGLLSGTESDAGVFLPTAQEAGGQSEDQSAHFQRQPGSATTELPIRLSAQENLDHGIFDGDAI